MRNQEAKLLQMVKINKHINKNKNNVLRSQKIFKNIHCALQHNISLYNPKIVQKKGIILVSGTTWLVVTLAFEHENNV